MKKIFGKIDTRREEKENEKAHSSFIGKKYNVGKHTVVVEVKQKCTTIRRVVKTHPFLIRRNAFKKIISNVKAT